MEEHPPTSAAHADLHCPAEGDDQPPLSWWLRGLLATASVLTGALMPTPDEPRERWHCPFCLWETA